MNPALFFGQSIRTIQLFYYSSHNHTFINTCLIELLNQKRLPQNVKIIKTQINEPKHHFHGQAPFITVNNSNVVKKTQIWDFLILILGIEVHRKYEFISVANLAEQISQVVNIFSEYDQNPYFTFISPWRKFKRHRQLQNIKHQFRQNTQYFNLHQNTMNKQYFLYKLNTLGRLLQTYSTANHTKPEFLFFYKMIIHSLMKHLKRVEETLYKVAVEMKIFVQIQNQIQRNIVEIVENDKMQRIPARNILFTNINMKAVIQKDDQDKKQENQIEYDSERQKFYQNIFKPVFATALFGLTMWAFRS